MSEANGTRQGLYYGMAFGPRGADGSYPVYAARGADNVVSVLSLAADGILTDTKRTIGASPDFQMIAGLATDSQGRRLYAASNVGDPKKQMTSLLHLVNPQTGALEASVSVPGYPYAVAAITRGADSDRKVYVGSEQRGVISVIDPVSAK
jgi:hypothetical protein